MTIPIVMVQEFPLLDGSVAGTDGKFLLDTGMQGARTINDHRVPISQA
ncbi:hypothetical protein [Sphingomonas psychrotolerans]|nr:hypothetical protein [Sphingomonas psychrotolerans]